MQEEKKVEWLCRKAKSIGELEGWQGDVWGTQTWMADCMEYAEHINQPTVFFGLYSFRDFYDLWTHKGRKCILWAGSDIVHFIKGYWLDLEGKIRLVPFPLCKWISENCESYVENQVEFEMLKEVGIESKIIPSFMGNVKDFPMCYKENPRPRLYTSVSGNNFKLYGWEKIEDLALKNPGVDFYLYGNTEPFTQCDDLRNVFVRGRISKEEMNEEVKRMTGPLRLTEFDGFSEIIAKGLLWGQWPVSIISYPCTIQPENMHTLKGAIHPNREGREWLLSVVNKYPWSK